MTASESPQEVVPMNKYLKEKQMMKVTIYKAVHRCLKLNLQVLRKEKNNKAHTFSTPPPLPTPIFPSPKKKKKNIFREASPVKD